jgi:Uma2 family endonuclease
MVSTLPKSLTLQEFLKLPETKPASEYIDGEIIQKPMPQGEHSVIQGELTSAANTALKPQKVARAFPELRCIFGGRAIVPDVTVFAWERIPRKENGGVAEVFDEPEQLLPVPSFARELQLTVGELFGWLLE